MQNKNLSLSNFSWFDPVNNDPQFIRLMAETLQQGKLSFDAMLLNRRGCPWESAGTCLNFLPPDLSHSLSTKGFAARATIAALYVPAIIRAIALLVKMPQPILVSSSLWFPQIDGVMVSLLRRFGIKFSILVHRPYSQRHSSLNSGNMYFSKLNTYVVLSKFTGLFLQNNYGIPAEKIMVLPLPNYNPVLDKSISDTHLVDFLSGVRQKGKRIVLCCSGITEGHGTLDLIKIAEAAHSKKSNLFFLVMGNVSGAAGKRMNEILKAKLQGKDNVEVRTGFYTDSQIKAALDNADVVLLPYRNIAQSAVLATALGQGVPVVASDVGGLSELIVHGFNGITVRSDSADTWVTALETENLHWTRSQIRENSERVHGSHPTCEFFHKWLSVFDKHI